FVAGPNQGNLVPCSASFFTDTRRRLHSNTMISLYDPAPGEARPVLKKVTSKPLDILNGRIQYFMVDYDGDSVWPVRPYGSIVEPDAKALRKMKDKPYSVPIGPEESPI